MPVTIRKLKFLFSPSQAFISIRRLSRFLSSSEGKLENEQATNSALYFSKGQSDITTNEEMAIVMEDASCAWYCNNQEDQKLVLDNVSLSLPKGLLIAVVGEVGFLDFQYAEHLNSLHTKKM